jgi:general secretion pathway protein C
MASPRPARPILLAICALGVLAVAIAWALRGPEPAARAPDARGAAASEPAPLPDVAAAPRAQAFAEPDPASAGYPHTRLPLRLLATVVRENPAYSLATIVDTERSEHEVMTEGQLFAGRPEARIARIERGRVLIDHDGVTEQLVLSQNAGAPPAPEPEDLAPTSEERSRRRDLAKEIRERIAGEREAGVVERGGVLAEGDFTPVYENGELVGVHFEGIEPGGFYDRIGLRNGDVVTDINGVSLADPAAAARVLGYVATSDELVVTVRRDDGSQQALAIPTEQIRTAVPQLE